MSDEEPPLPLERAAKSTTSTQNKAGAELPHSTQAWRTAPARVTPTHYKIDVTFEPERHFLRATAAVTLRLEELCDSRRGAACCAPRPGDGPPCPPDSTNAQAIEFELNRHLTLRSVTDDQGRALEFLRSPRFTSHKLLVRLAAPVDPRRGGPEPAPSAAEGCPPDAVVRPPQPANETGQTHRSAPTDSPASATQRSESPPACITLTFTYDGALPPAPLDYIASGGILLRDESRWYPATDRSAFTQNEIRATLPITGRDTRHTYGWQVVTSGEYTMESGCATGCETSVPKGFWQRTWKTERPVSSRTITAFPPEFQNCKGLTSFNAGPRKGPRSFINGCFRTPSSGGTRAPIIYGVAEALNWYSERILPYSNIPFHLVEGFPNQQGVIGYSAPGFLVVSEDVVKWHGHPGFAPEFLPHEIAHQWFPIEVTLRSEEDGWLAESLAEYLAWRYLEEKQPDDARRMVERAMRSTLATQPLRPLRLGLKLFALEDADVTHATLYQRGMLVWRTLETVIDRERLDRALREYYARHRGGPASIADFRRIVEEISGRDLAWFFDYYINGAELPSITLRRLPSAAPNELAGEIHIANVPPDFQVRVEMRITTADGVIDHSVATRGPVTPFAINVPAPVTSVTIDPRLRILRVTEPARRHRAQLAVLEQAGLTEEPDSNDDALRELVALFESAIALDAENLAANHQLYYLQIGRLQFRLKQYDAAWKSLDRALTLESLDPMATDFHRAWARVYRARIALTRGDRAAARREIDAALALNSPALETPAFWPDAPEHRTTAANALRALLAKL